MNTLEYYKLKIIGAKTIIILFCCKKFKVRYTVTGNGVASRSSQNYLKDPAVKDFLCKVKI